MTVTELEFDMGRVITIDGPAASGKTSVSRELAKRLGWSWVSTGAFYRGLAYVAFRLNYDLNDENALSELAASDKWRVEMDDENTKVFLGNEDVTDLINAEHVGNIASKISHFPLVRKALLAPQRHCQDKSDGLVAEGRDCGTIVFPTAEIKIFLTANSENRAERRARDQGLSKEETAASQALRDKQDSSRAVAPMKVPKDAFVVDTTTMGLKEVVGQIHAYIQEKI